jgi:hypothetical protein
MAACARLLSLAPRREDVLLSDKLLERTWSHARRERRRSGRRLHRFHFFFDMEEILHRLNYDAGRLPAN